MKYFDKCDQKQLRSTKNKTKDLSHEKKEAGRQEQEVTTYCL